MQKNRKALAIDIGGTKIAYSIVDSEGNFLSEIKKIATPKTKTQIEEALRSIVEEKSCEFEVVSIATAGSCNLENTKVTGSTGNLPLGYRAIDFQSFGEKVFVENDANCSAWCEYVLGNAKNSSVAIILTLGTGVGGAIISDDKLFRGKSGAAGEMHFAFSRELKRRCTCGFHDCFEAYASGNGLKTTAKEVFNDENMTTYKLVELLKKEDKTAQKAYEIWLCDVKLGCVGLANLFDPDCIVFSGSMAKFLNCQEIETFVNENSISKNIEIKNGKFENNSGMLGSALLAFRKF